MSQTDRILSLLGDYKGLTSDQISDGIGFEWSLGIRWQNRSGRCHPPASVRRTLVKMWRAGLVTRDESKRPYVYSKRRTKHER